MYRGITLCDIPRYLTKEPVVIYSETSEKRTSYIADKRTLPRVPDKDFPLKMSPYSGHLSKTDIFFWSRRCPLLRGFTVFGFQMNTLFANLRKTIMTSFANELSWANKSAPLSSHELKAFLRTSPRDFTCFQLAFITTVFIKRTRRKEFQDDISCGKIRSPADFSAVIRGIFS